MLSPLLSVALVIVCILLARQSRGADLDTLERLAANRYIPFALAVINGLLVWWMFGFELNPVPQIQDEAAYLLQAGIFARGNWTEAARPLPEFFAQMHVFTTPVLAAKYPPGTSLFLTPFVLLGFPVLAPVLLAGMTGALVFILARRVTNTAVATLSWILWTTAPWALRWQASFLSQTLTIVLWLGALHLLLNYRERHRPRTLVALSAVVGFCAITRPFTALALALPVGVVVMIEVWRVRAWRQLVLPIVVGSAIVGILPLHNHMTTGSWRLSPLVMYSRDYLPSDFPGFGLDSTPRIASLPPDLEQGRQELFSARRQHTLDALPQTLLHRWVRALTIVASGWRMGLLLLIPLAVAVLPPAGLLALGMSIGLLLAYAVHSHWPQWSQYYLEGSPGYVFAVAVGVWALASLIIRGPSSLRRATLWSNPDPRLALATVVAAVALGTPSALRIPVSVDNYHAELRYQRLFQETLHVVRRESPKAILFVDYGQVHNPHFSLVRNVPNLDAAPIWIAYERGVDDLRLMRLAPDRRAYIYKADKGVLTRLPSLPELERIVAAR